MGQHSRTNGMCYLCGRMPGEGHAAKAVAPGDKRHGDISTLAALIANATREQAEGYLDSWLSDEEYGWTVMHTIFGLVTTADADVAARARAAFARIGVTIPATMAPVAPMTFRRAS